MKKGEHYIVSSNEGCRHPVGTEVVIVHINPSESDSKPILAKPILARAKDGRTEYWYEPDALMSVNEWMYENR